MKNLRRLQTALFALLVAATTGVSSAGAGPGVILGKWHGNLQTAGGTLTLELSIEQNAEGKLSGELESVDQAPGELIPLSNLDFQNEHLAFEIASISARFAGRFDPEHDVFGGSWIQATQELPLTWVRGPVAAVPRIDGLDGVWRATLNRDGISLRLTLRVSTSPRGTKAKLDSPDAGIVGLDVVDLARTDSQVRLRVPRASVVFDATLDSSATHLNGEWRREGQAPAQVTFTRDALPSPTPAPASRDTGSASGVLMVAEDRLKPSGRTIDIHYVVMPATTTGARDPIFLIAGGPGQSVIKVGPSSIPGLVPDRDRDVVMVDQRGTGESHPLECNMFPTEADAFRAIYPLDIIAACRSRLAATSDLGAYGTDAAADDLNDVRLHLGYQRIVVAGDSYGTTVTLDYLRRHGESVAAAILEGVAPPGPLSMARGAQTALDDLERRCKAETACSAAFPQFEAEFQTLLVRAKHGGIKVEGGVISSDVLVERMRDALYSEAVAAYIPLIVHRAVHGDQQPLAQLVSTLSNRIPGSLATGMFLSVTCPEDVAFMALSDVAKESANTFLGDARFREQQAACRVWNVKAVDRAFLDPIRSDVPVLMISGEDDPATPPRYGAEALRYLPNGRQVIAPHAGHFTGSNCVDSIKRQFLGTYDVRSLDITCLTAAQRSPFVTN